VELAHSCLSRYGKYTHICHICMKLNTAKCEMYALRVFRVLLARVKSIILAR